ncbi:hypothetical protein Tco_0554154 [Tanacetum coccineum]
MSITKEQQQALDDALVPREQRLTIGSCNYRLSTTFKPKEPTFQVALDVLTLTPFYPAFLITVSVPAVYMQEFWATVTYQKHHIRFKMNKKSHSFDMETFRNMLLICPKLPGQKFVDPPFKEEILTFIRELGYPGNIKLLSDVKVDTLPQPWRTFGRIINKCLSGKEDLVFQIKNKESRKNKYMFYLRFTKVIINHFKSQDLSILRRNKVDWHMANDDPILKTMRFIPQHEVVQRYGAILLDYLTNPTMKESEDYKTYHDLATGNVQPKLKYVRRSSRTKTDEAPKPSSDKRVKSTAMVAKSGKKNQPALGLETLSEITLTKAEQLKPATKRSLIQTHSSYASGSSAHEGTGVTSRVLDVPDYESDDEQISWKSSEEEDDEVNVSEHDNDNDDERTESDNDGEDFVHPKFSTHDDEARQEEVNEEDSFDPRVQTPSHVESTDDDNSDEEVQGANTKEEEMVEEATHEEDEANELYRDVNINLEGRDTVMTDASLPNVHETQETEDTHVILTALIIPEGQQQSSSMSSGFVSNMLNPRPDTGIDSIFNTEVILLVDVPVTTIVEPPLVFGTTLPPPPTHLITHMKQIPFPIPTTAPSSMLDLEEPTYQEFDIGATEEQSDNETSQHPNWLSNLARQENPHELFDELTDTPFDFLAFVINRLKVETMTPKLLASPTFELMKGTCKSLVELEYFFEEVYKETTEQLDWHNPEGQQYPHDLRKPLPLIPNSRGRQVIPFDHFINNDLAYLCGGVSSRTYATSVTKTKAADYSHIKWIEELVPNAMWSQTTVNYDKYALWGISHWGRKRKQFYGFAVNRESAHDVYSRRRIIAVTKLQIVEWHGYKHLDWITVRRDDDKLHTFKEGDFKRLRLQDIEDMLLLLVQGKLTNLNVEERVESYQKKLNITKLDSYRSDLKRREAYSAYSNRRGFIYQNKDKKNKLMRIDELHKFSDGTLDVVQTTLNDRLKGIRMEYLPKTIWR